MRLAILAIVALVAINAENSSPQSWQTPHVSVEEDLLTPIEFREAQPATELVMAQQWSHRHFHWGKHCKTTCGPYHRPVCVAKSVGHHKFEKGKCDVIKEHKKKAKAKAKERKKKAKKAKKKARIKKWIAHHKRHHLVGKYHDHKFGAPKGGVAMPTIGWELHSNVRGARHQHEEVPTFGTMVEEGYDSDDVGADGDDGLGY